MTKLLTRRALIGRLKDRVLQWYAGWFAIEVAACADDVEDESTADAGRDARVQSLDDGGGDDGGGEPVDISNASFAHGVASGDPRADRVVIWTRLSGVDAAAVSVTWEVATNDELSDVVAQGETEAHVDRDYTVKVDVTGLDAATAYHYRFTLGGVRSPVGRTRTLPTGNVERVRLAVVSCSAMMSGYYSSYAAIADQDVDAVIHLGDYIYEYAADNVSYNSDLPGRSPVPEHEAETLADYRARYAQYRTDKDLARVHAAHPMICIWDDHEVVDDVWNEGAAEHARGEAGFVERRSAAKRAFVEWLPVRETVRDGGVSLYDGFAFGNLVDLLLLDTRLEDRDMPGEREPASDASTLLGMTQEEWLHEQLRSSKARWRLLASQTMVGQLDVPGFFLDLQAWDGFPAVRDRLFDVIEDNGIGNLVALSGTRSRRCSSQTPRTRW